MLTINGQNINIDGSSRNGENDFASFYGNYNASDNFLSIQLSGDKEKIKDNAEICAEDFKEFFEYFITQI